MDIRSMVAAAAMVVGIGQAEAATYDVALRIQYQSYTCDISLDPCEGTPDIEDNYKGIPLYISIKGIIELPDDHGNILFFSRKENLYDAYFGNYTKNGNYYYSDFVGVDYFHFNPETGSGGFGFANDAVPWARELHGSLSRIDPAAVPLPASAALLPLGFGGLAMMRRRRKVR